MGNQTGVRLDDLRIFTGSSLKITACISMFIDHFSKVVLLFLLSQKVFPLVQQGVISQSAYQEADHFVRSVLCGIGRIAFPLFCFLLTEGFLHTKKRRRYLGSMLLFAGLSEIPFDLAFFSFRAIKRGTFPFYWGYQNVFFTLSLGLLCMTFLEKMPQLEKGQSRKETARAMLLQGGTVVFFAGVARILRCDYSSKGVLFIAVFYLLRGNRLLQVLGFLGVYLATTGNRSVYILVSILLIFLYNGKRGNLRLKYFFYWFYPVHLTLLYLLQWALVS